MEAKRGTVGLVFLDRTCFPAAILEVLNRAGARATFICPPDRLVVQASAWRDAVAAGHELANSALVGVTLDGRIENWPPTALQAELEDADRLLHDLGQTKVHTCFLPGTQTLDSGGEYRHFIESRYEVCLCPVDEQVRIGARDVNMCALGSNVVLREPMIVVGNGSEDELDSLNRLLTGHDALSVAELYLDAKERIGPPG
jgi:hypothetical protein